MAIKRIRNHGKWVWPGSYSMIHAFAGDSVTSDVVACGVAVFQEDRVAAAEELLRIEKVVVGIPADERLHCRVMFSDHGRAPALRHARWRSGQRERLDAVVLRRAHHAVG